MITLGEDGLAKVKSGITTPEELLRVVTEVREVRTLCTSCGAAVAVDFVACPNCGKRQGGGCPPRTSPSSRSKSKAPGDRVAEDALRKSRAPADGHRGRDQEIFARADRAVSPRQGSPPRQRVPGHGSGSRRGADRGVDGSAPAETWTEAGKWTSEEVCVLLLGSSLASARELATAISEQRKRSRASKVTLIPVDARDWAAHMPTDAPEVAAKSAADASQRRNLGSQEDV
jgi:hypothetical protein